MLNELASLRPEDAQVRQMLLDCYDIFDMPVQKVKIAYEMYHLVPGDTLLLKRLVNLYHTHELFDEEIAILEQLSRLLPDPSQYLWQLAQLYNQTKNVKLEIATYEKMVTLQPRNSNALKQLASLYGGVGDFEKQVNATRKVAILEPTRLPARKALILAYGNALGNQNLSFRLKEADKMCQDYFRHDPTDQQIKQVHLAIKGASPIVGIHFDQRNYNFIQEINQLENFITVSYEGPLKNSWLLLDAGYISLHPLEKAVQSAEETIIESKSISIYRSHFTWNQNFGKLKSQFTAGIHKLASTPLTLTDKLPKLISNIRLNYAVNKKAWITGAYALDYLTISPGAIEAEIYHHELECNFVYNPWKQLFISTHAQVRNYSDRNRSEIAGIDLTYNLLKTLLKIKNLEKDLPVGFDETGTQLQIGSGYGYLNFDKERLIYPTAANEHFIKGFISFEKQLIQSLFLKSNGFIERDNLRQTYWGYNVSLSKIFYWRLNLAIEYENFRSPYTENGIRKMNVESRFDLKINAHF
jgi:tetratricopeptide (TPR) repeat protein